MARTATERMQTHVTVGVARIGQQRPPSRVLFCAVDGPMRVLIEADNVDDARCLCREMALEFICFCD